MRMIWNCQKTGVIGLSLIFLICGINFSFGFPVVGVQTPSDQKEEDIQSNQPKEKKDPQNPPPILPPTNDPEMVIEPKGPPDPDAVVTPPVVDPEMAVDPATRQPMTPEKLERLTPEELEKGHQEQDK